MFRGFSISMFSYHRVHDLEHHTSVAGEIIITVLNKSRFCWINLAELQKPIGSMYAIYGDIYHQYTPNVSIYTIHGSYG